MSKMYDAPKRPKKLKWTIQKVKALHKSVLKFLKSNPTKKEIDRKYDIISDKYEAFDNYIGFSREAEYFITDKQIEKMEKEFEKILSLVALGGERG